MSKPTIALQLGSVRVVRVPAVEHWPAEDRIEVIVGYDAMGDPRWNIPSDAQEWRHAATILAGELTKKRQEVSA